MRIRSGFLVLLLAALPARGGEEPPQPAPPVAPAPESGTPGARPPSAPDADGTDVAAAVWRAVDAPDAAYGKALAELTALPGVTWSLVADVLRVGRDYRTMPRPAPAVSDPVAFGAYFDAFPWDEGKVRRYDLGDDAAYWYSVELPAGYDGSAAVPVWFDFGLFAEGAPPGFARVRLNDLIAGSLTLGKAQASMTAGYAVQSAVLSVLADLERRFRCDRDRVFCGGYSRFGNMTWYEGVHWPDAWAGIAPASGYYEFDDALLPNLRHVAVLAASGRDPGHRASNEFTARTAGRLKSGGHGDVTTHAPKGRAIEGLGEPFLAWIAARRRTALPKSVTYVLVDPRHRGAYWLDIVAVKSPGPPHTVVIGAPGDTSAERFDVHTRPASATAEVTGPNAVTVRSTNVAELRLYLSPALFDLAAPVRVTAGGRVTDVQPAPSVETLLRNFRRDGDRERLFPAEVVLRI